VNELLARYETFEPSREVIARYLEQARQALRVLPESGGRAGLFGLADFLAQQTDALAVCI
jgi:geranylgeranyl pyrophosphate synthase